MTQNHARRLSILAAWPVLCALAALGCEARTGLLTGRGDAGVLEDEGGSGGSVATGAGGAIGAGGTPNTNVKSGLGGAIGAGGTPNTNVKPGLGGASGAGGKSGTGGAIGMGGNMGMGGTMSMGGTNGNSTKSVNTGGSSAPSTGGKSGNSGLGGNMSTGGTTMAAPPTIDDSGYVKVSAGTVVMVGYISSSTAGSGSSISLTYGPSDFCAKGTVAANNTYKSWAVAGFSVNEDPSGASGSSSALVLSGTTISISYVNHTGSQLEFQLYDGSHYWCHLLPPSSVPTTTTMPFSGLNTQCWDGNGDPFTSGTAITNVNLVVPGSNATSTPFDFCFLGLSVN